MRVGDCALKEWIWDGELGAVGLDKVTSSDIFLEFQSRHDDIDAHRPDDRIGEDGFSV